MKTIIRLENTADLIECCRKVHCAGEEQSPSVPSAAKLKLVRGQRPSLPVTGTLQSQYQIAETPDKVVLVDETGAFEFEDTLENFLSATCRHFDLPGFQK